MSSLINLRRLHIQAPSNDDKRADEQRIRDALDMEPLEVPLSVLRGLPLHQGREVPCVIGKKRNGFKVIDLLSDESYSVALDLGTTNLVASLHDNVTGRVVSQIKVENPQIRLGSDVMTRMHHAMEDRSAELVRDLLTGVNAAIKGLCADAGIDTGYVHALTAAGNTVMSHFFLGLDVSRIPVEPFVPIVRSPGFFRASDLELHINPEALVYVFSNAGSYVGGDIVAGILASGMYTSEDPCVLIDVGTNAEIVIGNRDWLLVGAGAAGPALEEGIAGIGKRAERGIIYDVLIEGGGMECRTFDNASPQGICGSGMISLIYEMYKAGIIGSDGILDPAYKGVDMLDGERFFSLSCSSEDGLVIRQTEIDNFLRSKAAMFTLLLVLLRSVGLQFSDIRKVYVAGALGNGIDAGKAAGIGMLPAWPAEAIIPIGNASLSGAQLMLSDGTLPELEEEIIDRITYKHMHDDPEFMKEFAGGIFIPHTSPELLRVDQ